MKVNHLLVVLNSADNFAFSFSAIQCEPPVEISNGALQVPKEIVVGSVVQYTCNPGYKMIGPNILTCSANGQFDALPPACERKYSFYSFRNRLLFFFLK